MATRRPILLPLLTLWLIFLAALLYFSARSLFLAPFTITNQRSHPVRVSLIGQRTANLQLFAIQLRALRWPAIPTWDGASITIPPNSTKTVFYHPDSSVPPETLLISSDSVWTEQRAYGQFATLHPARSEAIHTLNQIPRTGHRAELTLLTLGLFAPILTLILLCRRLLSSHTPTNQSVP